MDWNQILICCKEYLIDCLLKSVCKLTWLVCGNWNHIKIIVIVLVSTRSVCAFYDYSECKPDKADYLCFSYLSWECWLNREHECVFYLICMNAGISCVIMCFSIILVYTWFALGFRDLVGWGLIVCVHVWCVFLLVYNLVDLTTATIANAIPR